MKIKSIKGISPNILLWLIVSTFEDTRFSLGHKAALGKKRQLSVLDDQTIELGSVRLKTKKVYCGNHPSACQRLIKEPERARNYLEGADWVEFNDRLNDLLDSLGVSARIFSVLWIRRGWSRCIAYVQNSSGRPGVNDDWARRGHYGKFVSLPLDVIPRATIPFGTPGINEQQNYNVVG